MSFFEKLSKFEFFKNCQNFEFLKNVKILSFLRNCRNLNFSKIFKILKNCQNFEFLQNFPEVFNIFKISTQVNASWSKNRLEVDGRLKILIQVNTSGEENKNGIEPEKLLELYDFINDKCEALKCEGLMTIGEFGFDYSKGPNPDFVALMECLREMPNHENLEVSFGM